jgi:hypothetical protein
MPVVPFETLPANARVWVFASDAPIAGEQAELLLGVVDDYLGAWRAHGQPLTCGRVWRDDRFLAVAVDQTDAYASGCSIDGLFRTLQQLQQRLGASLVGGGRVFYRTSGGAVTSVARDEFARLGEEGQVTGATAVFDPTVATAAEWATRFETEAASSWHAQLLPATLG